MRVHKPGDDPLHREPQLPSLKWGPSSEVPLVGCTRSGGPGSLSEALRILPGT